MDVFVAAARGRARATATGHTKTRVRLAHRHGRDLRVVPAASFGAALLYFTGCKAHNVALRRIAIEKGLKLNEYGVFRGERARRRDRGGASTRALGLPYIPPELREDQGEIEAARAGRLPTLIEPGTLRGDLQTQTDWTDGADSIEAMARAARALGLEYIAITDHTRDLAMTGGCDEAKLREQGAADRRAEPPGCAASACSNGAEVNIRKDGTLDIADAALAELDVVGVAVHSHFHLSARREDRARDPRHGEPARRHPLPSDRARARPARAVDLDIDAVIAAATRTGTVLEIDAFPSASTSRTSTCARPSTPA